MLNTEYGQIYLYAKGHYERGDVMTDLRKIVSHRSGSRVEHISRATAIKILISAAVEYIACTSLKRPRSLDFELNELFTRIALVPIGVPEEEDDPAWLKVTNELLSYLSTAQVSDGAGGRWVELPRPDPEILPLKRSPTAALDRRHGDGDRS